jgi:phage baseplate assembly protein W
MVTLTKNKEYKDVDFSFNKHPDSGNILSKSKANAVKQSVINLLTLKLGDKPFHPEIASPINKYLFKNFSVLEKVVLQGEIKTYLTNYETRLNVTEVNVGINSHYLSCEVKGNIVNLTDEFVVNILIERLR